MRHMRSASCLVAGVLGFAALADAASTIDFEQFTHGQIINTQINGVTISANNVNRAFDWAVVFDSTKRSTRDPDLEGPNGTNGLWNHGNIAASEILGKMLIIQEDGALKSAGVVRYPDDEGNRPAGTLTFRFDEAIDSFGFDLIDVEGPSEYGQNSGYFATFLSGGSELARVGFGDLINPASLFYMPGVQYGDNSANRIAPLTSAMLGIGAFDTVVLNFGGSAAVDNIVYSTAIPTPAAVWAGLSLIGLLTAGRSLRRGARDIHEDF